MVKYGEICGERREVLSDTLGKLNSAPRTRDPPKVLLSDACTETCIERCASGWVGYKDKCYKLSDTSESWSVGEKSCRCWIFSKFDSVALETRVDTWLQLAAVMFMTFSSNG